MNTFENEFDALQQAVGCSGKSFKEVAAHLWPAMKPESAYAKLKACLNPDGDEHLRFGQVIALMKFCNSYQPLQYICDETMHARPDRKAPADYVFAISTEIQCAAETITKAIAALERLQTRRDL